MTQSEVLTNINSLLKKKEEYIQALLEMSEKAGFADTDEDVTKVEEYFNKRQVIMDEVDKLDGIIKTCGGYLNTADPLYDKALFKQSEERKTAIKLLVSRCVESDKKNTLAIERLVDRIKVDIKDFQESKRVNKQYQFEVTNNDGVFFDKKH